ncbi:MAG: hypothetical protein DRN40_04275 [Thermoplasmata archaeon]|nr:MAG: hypothetical protein DRN40_04275 [Thermoplasmata archaeon]
MMRSKKISYDRSHVPRNSCKKKKLYFHYLKKKRKWTILIILLISGYVGMELFLRFRLNEGFTNDSIMMLSAVILACILAFSEVRRLFYEYLYLSLEVVATEKGVYLPNWEELEKNKIILPWTRIRPITTKYYCWKEIKRVYECEDYYYFQIISKGGRRVDCVVPKDILDEEEEFKRMLYDRGKLLGGGVIGKSIYQLKIPFPWKRVSRSFLLLDILLFLSSMALFWYTTIYKARPPQYSYFILSNVIIIVVIGLVHLYVRNNLLYEREITAPLVYRITETELIFKHGQVVRKHPLFNIKKLRISHTNKLLTISAEYDEESLIKLGWILFFRPRVEFVNKKAFENFLKMVYPTFRENLLTRVRALNPDAEIIEEHG